MFWEHADGRCAIVREIRRRYLELKEDCGADSIAKDLLVQRAVFVALQLETTERTAAEGGSFDSGKYGQLVNTLVGLLRSLGLERHIKKVANLADYVESKK